MKISGIYKIINKINLNYYVGSSKDISFSYSGRFYGHKNKLIKNKHSNDHLQRAWNKYGAENFDFIVIEENIPKENLLKVEQLYLDKAKTEKDKVYNVSFIAGKVEMTDEVKEKISDSIRQVRQNPKKIKPKRKYNKINTIYDLTHKSGENFKGTGTDFTNKYGFKLGGLITRRTKTRKGWNFTNDQNPVNKNRNINIYSFFNSELNIKYVGTCLEFYRKYPDVNKGNLFSLIKGRVESVNGWKLSNSTFKKSFSNPQDPLKKKPYKITSPTGEIFITKNLADFCRRNHFNQSGFRHVLKGRIKTVRGWRIEFIETALN